MNEDQVTAAVALNPVRARRKGLGMAALPSAGALRRDAPAVVRYAGVTDQGSSPSWRSSSSITARKGGRSFCIVSQT